MKLPWLPLTPVAALSSFHAPTARVLPDSATESACLEAVSAQTDAQRSRYFRSVVRTWVRAAYGARPPSAGELETLLDGYVTAFGAEPA